MRSIVIPASVTLTSAVLDPPGHDAKRFAVMRLRISHSTTYTYDPPPTGVIQVLRLTPGNHDGQYVADWHVDVSVDTRLDMQHDAFGNVTHVFSHGPLTTSPCRCRAWSRPRTPAAC